MLSSGVAYIYKVVLSPKGTAMMAKDLCNVSMRFVSVDSG